MQLLVGSVQYGPGPQYPVRIVNPALAELIWPGWPPMITAIRGRGSAGWPAPLCVTPVSLSVVHYRPSHCDHLPDLSHGMQGCASQRRKSSGSRRRSPRCPCHAPEVQGPVGGTNGPGQLAERAIAFLT